MSTSTESVTRRDAEAVWNSEGNLDEIDDLVAEDFVYHNPMVTEEVRSPDGYRELAETSPEVTAARPGRLFLNR